MYKLIIIISVILLIIGIYKIKFPFWSKQPVFHFHNLKYWIIPPGIIQHENPEKNKFYDEKIFFDMYDNIPIKIKNHFAFFIKKHYLPNKQELYNPSKIDVLNYLQSHNRKSYLSIMYDKNNSKRMVGTMSSRPLDCFIGNNKLPVQYVDFLCVHKKYRKKGLAPKIIYTHYVNCRDKKSEPVFLFKREGDVTSIVPLTAYNNYLFDISRWDKSVVFDEPTINTILITENTFNYFFDVYERLMKSKFKCIITPHLNHIKSLLLSNQIFITVTLINKQPYDIFIFHNTHTTYNGNKSMECICSFKETDESVFVLGFMCSISLIYNEMKFTRLFIENISNNNIILKKIIERYREVEKTKASYYFYNFGYRPFLSSEVFILN